jgi:hypothetical protein
VAAIAAFDNGRRRSPGASVLGEDAPLDVESENPVRFERLSGKSISVKPRVCRPHTRTLWSRISAGVFLVTVVLGPGAGRAEAAVSDGATRDQ